MPNRSPLIFVYGTLTPGHAPDCVADLVGRFRLVGPATVGGALYDCGNYPGLVLSDDGTVRGSLCEVPDDPLLWRRLDAYEGFDPASPATSLFRRVTTAATTHDGRAVDCQTYVYGHAARPSRRIAGGDWFNRPTPGRPAPMSTADASTRRPVIGITIDYSDDNPSRYMLPSDYTRSVERAGGLPMVLPFRTDLSLIPQFVDALDGVLFTGGTDLDPALFGQPRHPKATPIDPARQTFELALLAEVERRRTPALGVCLGSQLMNVHRGGSLVQFLPDVGRDGAIEHRDLGDRSYRHDVRIEPDTVLAEAIGQGVVSANSRHKQAVDRVGRGLRANAFAPDGVVEGIEDPTFPLFLGVQWHPENLTADSAEHLAPFELLVRKASAARP